MTALTLSAGREEDASLRPLPWQRMVWVTWRQHRTPLVSVAVFLGALAVGIWLAGRTTHHVFAAAVAACESRNSVACAGMSNTLIGTYGFLSNGFILQGVPVLIGAFAGAPVLARELETGTFRYAWTQGFGRWRWTLAKLVPLAVMLAAAAGVFSLLLNWYYQPYFTEGNQALGLTEYTPFFPGLFDLRGIGFAAWTLVAFAIGALAGMLIRRVVPAIVATLAAYTALAFAAGSWLRPAYMTPVVTSNLNVPGSAWVMSQWWTKGGRFAFAGSPPQNLLNQFCPDGPAGPVGPGGTPKATGLAECLIPHGYTQWTSYQPVSRFWAFQWIEAGWLLALSVLLIAATVWLVRRRAA
ncbi:MAG: ABC transporter permease subunit [Actinobacteria bacterium]|nr:ABC transporter permease subunit [Actinomycetota bacterium]